MEDDFEEYWAAIRPERKPSMKDLRDELLKIAKLREEEWDLMTHRNYPSPPESLFEESREEPFFNGPGESIPADLPLVVNIGNPDLGDVATREYIESILHTYSEVHQFHIDGGGSVRVDYPPSIIGDGPISGGGSLLITTGEGLQASSWGSTNELRLELQNNSEFRVLQDRVTRLEQENRELRSRVNTLALAIRNRR